MKRTTSIMKDCALSEFFFSLRGSWHLSGVHHKIKCRSILTLAFVVIAALWLVMPLSAAIAGSVITSIFIITSIIFVTPGILLSWHLNVGIKKELVLESDGSNSHFKWLKRKFVYALRSVKLIRKQSSILNAMTTRRNVIEGSSALHWAAYHGGAGHRMLLSVLIAAGEDLGKAVAIDT